MRTLQIADRLAEQAARLSFGPPVTHVYNPLIYARSLHAQYLKRFARGSPQAILLGMNPGPWGMVQTGVPFGEVSAVRDWMGLRGKVTPPTVQHPKVPIHGLKCPRREISGQRLWGWAKDAFGTPGAFFRRFLVLNYCPLAFLELSGCNRTPDKLPAGERKLLEKVCNQALREMVGQLRPKYVVGIGRYAEDRAHEALDELDVRVGRILHPSPASPAANRGWAKQAVAQLRRMGIGL